MFEKKKKIVTSYFRTSFDRKIYFILLHKNRANYKKIKTLLMDVLFVKNNVFRYE